MEELSDDQRFANYCRLIQTINYIEEENRITEDWMEKQKKFIDDIREGFSMGFQNVNDDIKDRQFRTTAQETEVILNSLLTSIQYDKTFKVSQYHSLLIRILKLFKIANQHYAESDELADFMQKMTLR